MADKHTTEEEPIETVRVREVVGVLHTHEDLDTVVRGLTSAGFNRADIDLMASRDAILSKLKNNRGLRFSNPSLQSPIFAIS